MRWFALPLLLSVWCSGAMPSALAADPPRASGIAEPKDKNPPSDGDASGLAPSKDAGGSAGGASGLSVPKDPASQPPYGANASGLGVAKDAAPGGLGSLQSLRGVGGLNDLFTGGRAGEKGNPPIGQAAIQQVRPSAITPAQAGQGAGAGATQTGLGSGVGTQAQTLNPGSANTGSPPGGNRLGALGTTTIARFGTPSFSSGANK